MNLLFGKKVSCFPSKWVFTILSVKCFTDNYFIFIYLFLFLPLIFLSCYFHMFSHTWTCTTFKGHSALIGIDLIKSYILCKLQKEIIFHNIFQTSSKRNNKKICFGQGRQITLWTGTCKPATGSPRLTVTIEVKISVSKWDRC